MELKGRLLKYLNTELMPFWHGTDRFVLAPDAASSEAGMHHSVVEMKYDDDDDDLLDRDGETGGGDGREA